MQKFSNSLGIATVLALSGLAVTSFVAGCGSDVAITNIGSGGSGGGEGPMCGNGVVEGTEACDDGNTVSGDGCEADCSFSCDITAPDKGAAKCDDGDPCNGTETCSETHACLAGMNQADGSSCGTGKICVAGVCGDDICGDGFVNTTEECDDGNKVDGDGCDTSCKLSCVSTDPTRDCAGIDPCVGNICDDTTHTCSGAIPTGDVCGLNAVCENGVCSPTVCGNKIVEAGEECDDGNNVSGDGCQADCTLPIAGSVCGNGMRETGEQCDDTNTKNLDGCDASCKYEQVQRATWMHIQFATDSFCPANKLGAAISTTAQGQVQTSLDTGIKDGSISILLKTMGLNNPVGTSDPSIEVGFLAGTPSKPAGVTYDGTADLDWWHTISAASIDANRDPLEKLAGYIANGTLNAGPGNVSLGINFAGTPAKLSMSEARLIASIGPATTPLTSTGMTPGHLAAEHLDPALQSYSSSGQPTDAGAGKLCGNVAASSLAQVPIPAALVSGQIACDQKYTTTNTLLDVFVNGCTVFNFVTVITPTQPDQADPGMPAAGAGAPYTFTVNAATKAVTGCRDKNNQTVDFNTCRNAAAYSAFFKFATGRVIPK